MNRRKFLQFLGIGAPAAVVAAVVAPKVLATVRPPQGESYTEFQARLGSWHNYHNESSPEIAKAIKEYEASSVYFDRELLARLKKEQPQLFTSAVARNVQVGTTVPRSFFTYNVGKM